MEIRIEYSSQQLEDTVKFIASSNKHFLGQNSKIRETILQTMRDMAKPDSYNIQGTMGFLIVADRVFEGMDADQTTCHFEFYVDPSLTRDHKEADFVEEVIDV